MYRNKICDNFIQIIKTDDKGREIKKLDKNIIESPYLLHLEDIYNFTKDKNIKNSHTILNSLRQVIEILRDFEAPNFCNNNDDNNKKSSNNKYMEEFLKSRELDNCIGLYTAINNGSHGLFFNYSKDEKRKMCESLIGYINEKYKDIYNLLEEQYNKNNK